MNRKPNRLAAYDYSRAGVYFITICVQDRRPLLSRIPLGCCAPGPRTPVGEGRPEYKQCVNLPRTPDPRTPAGASIARPPSPELTPLGEIVNHAILSIPSHYSDVSVDHYVIMPNHIHLLMRIDRDPGRAMLAPTDISRVIQQLKGFITKQYGKAFWQKSFYDHIVRDESDYRTRWQYIDENPARWAEDEFFDELT